MAISGHTASGRPHSPAGAPAGASLTDSSFQVTGGLQDVLNGDPKEGVQPEMFIPVHADSPDRSGHQGCRAHSDLARLASPQPTGK